MRHLNFLIIALVGLMLSSCATKEKYTGSPDPKLHKVVAKPPTPKIKAAPRVFTDSTNATIIIHYFSDAVSYGLKPAQKQGEFFSILTYDQVLGLAKEQPNKRTAVVIFGQFYNLQYEAKVKQKIAIDLNTLGYGHIVYLNAGTKEKADGLGISMDLNSQL